MATDYIFERCPLCMEPMDKSRKACTACGFTGDSVEAQRLSILRLPQDKNFPFYGGALLGHFYFGNSYIGYSSRLNKKVLLREYQPFPVLLHDHDHPGQFKPHPGDENTFREASEKVIREAQALSKLIIPGAEQIYGAFRANGTVYQVAEHICGFNMYRLTISDLMKAVPVMFPSNGLESEFPALALYRLIRPLLLLLQRMHFNNIFHGNLDPGCILVDVEHMRLVLGGLGTSAARLNHYTVSSALEPDNIFLPFRFSGLTPEQTDIFAICKVIYRLITGEHPNWHELSSPDEFDGFHVPPELEKALRKGSTLEGIKTLNGMADLISELDETFTQIVKQIEDEWYLDGPCNFERL